MPAMHLAPVAVEWLPITTGQGIAWSLCGPRPPSERFHVLEHVDQDRRGVRTVQGHGSLRLLNRRIVDPTGELKQPVL